MVGEQVFERRDLELGISDGIFVQVLNGIGKSDKIKVWNQVQGIPDYAQKK
jgi:HlyD family secretion protein